MPIRLPCVTVLVAVLLGGNVRAAAAPAEERRLVVVEAAGNVLTKATRQRLHAAIAEVAAGQGLVVASAEGLPAKLRSCELPACLPSIAAATGAVFVLRVDAKFAQESFKLAVELWNSDDGRQLGKDRRDCPICDEPDLWGSAALMTQAILERTLHEPAKLSPAPAAGSRAIVPPPAVPSVAGATTTTPDRFLRYTGAGLAVAGLAALGTGIYYWHVDGSPACTDCDLLRDTRKFGIPMTIAGGAVLVAGVGLIAWSFRAGPAQVALAPSGLRLTGQF
jgi:uncharacterized protein YjeT (DUF2065 family)